MKKAAIILTLLVTGSMAFGQHGINIDGLKKYLESQGFKYEMVYKEDRHFKRENCVMSRTLNIKAPQNNDFATDSDRQAIQVRLDSLSLVEQHKMKLVTDSVRKYFYSLASKSTNSDFYERRKDGKDTVKYVLDFYDSYSVQSTFLNYPVSNVSGRLSFNFYQNLRDDSLKHQMKCTLGFYQAETCINKKSKAFDVKAYDSVITSSFQQLIDKKIAQKTPVFWRINDYIPKEGEILIDKNVYDVISHDKPLQGTIQGTHYFISAKYKEDGKRQLQLIDSLTLDYIDKHPNQTYYYGPDFPFSTPIRHTCFIANYENGFNFNNSGSYTCLLYEDKDGMHVFSISNEYKDLWFPREFTKLERWENGKGKYIKR